MDIREVRSVFLLVFHMDISFFFNIYVNDIVTYDGNKLFINNFSRKHVILISTQGARERSATPLLTVQLFLQFI